jgi:transcriptional regulator with XRE-family HTH domain
MADPDAWAVELGERIARARKRAMMTQDELAQATAVSKVWISKLERGLVARPGHRKLNQIAAVLGDSVIPHLGDGGPITFRPAPALNVVGRVGDELRPIEGARLLPVYRWGSAGDPRDQDNNPDADHEEYPPVGRESLVGPRGFGVLIRGESMARRGIHDGDVVWINPERPYRLGRPVLARLFERQAGQDEDIGMVVKTLVRGEDSIDRLRSDCDESDEIVQCERFEVIGPVVGISPAFRLPT